MREVERIIVSAASEPSAQDARQLSERLEQGETPLVLAGAAAHFHAVSSWTPAYLAQRIGAVEIDYKCSSSHVHPDFHQSEIKAMFARRHATFAEFLELLSQGPEAERAHYLFTGDEQFLLRRRAGVTTIHPGLAPLLEDVEVPHWFPEERLYTVWSWFSGRGVRTWLHYDNNGCHNLNAQITGRKDCWLFAPDELARMHPFPLGGKNPAHNCSQIDAEHPQSAFAADFGAARAWHAQLAAGDVLFIPAWWFHTFQHHGQFNSNVNFWWRPEHARWNVVSARQALLDAAATAELPDRAAAAPVLQALDAAAVRRSAI
jgi:hypothetical protein